MSSLRQPSLCNWMMKSRGESYLGVEAFRRSFIIDLLEINALLTNCPTSGKQTDESRFTTPRW
jgi:hypothetical protein